MTAAPAVKLAGLGTWEDQRYREGLLSRQPRLRFALERDAEQAALSALVAGDDPNRAANIALRESMAQLKVAHTGLTITADDLGIRRYCEARAQGIHRNFTDFAKRLSLPLALDWLQADLARSGLELPIDQRAIGQNEKTLSAVARVCCPKWWRRKMRVLVGRQREQWLRSRGYVCRQRSPYVSELTRQERRSQKARNHQLLLGLEAVSDEGDVINLAEAAAAGVSNPENRRCELMVRMRGYEEIAQALGLQSEFLTLTCPSAYHPILHKSGTKNPKYNGTDPREAQEYLCRQWAGIRAEWAQAGIKAFGFRVAEPHHDGTPHWHMVLHFRPEEADRAWEIFRRYALAEDGHEWRAEDVRAVRVIIDPSKGTATGYLAKYIAKNIDGYAVGHDLEAQTPAEEGAAAVDAWAGVWGIRQFQQIGSTSVTIWREFRRVRDRIEGADAETLEAIRAACDAGNWREFVELMGGVFVRRDEQTVRLLLEEKPGESLYGEIIEQIRGVIMRGARLAAHMALTRVKVWTVQRTEPPAATGPPTAGRLDLCQ